MSVETTLRKNPLMSANRDELDSLLRQAFAEGVHWPIDRPSLRALAHLGLTIPQIARYFSVDPVKVQALLKPPAPGGSGAISETTNLG
jgi:hypothetical protein